MQTDIAAAVYAARQAGELLLKYFQAGIDVKYKDGVYDPVTQADKKSDKLLRSTIGQKFPNDQILTEENRSHPTNYRGRVWVIDPLDGTKDFILGRDTFSVIIGMLLNGEPSVGVVLLPARGELYYAQRNGGAFRVVGGRTSRVRVSAVSSLAKARMLVRIPTPELRALDKPIEGLDVRERITGGSVGSRLCAIASNQADLFINTHHRVSKWDTLGGQVVLSEAGGVMLGLSQAPLDYMQPDDRWREPFVAASTLPLALQAIKSLESHDF